MTTIYNTTTKELMEAEVIANGMDCLQDVMGNWGLVMSTMDDVDFELDDEDASWWLRWAEREQRIIDTAEEMGERATDMLAELSAQYGEDLELDRKSVV